MCMELAPTPAFRKMTEDSFLDENSNVSLPQKGRILRKRHSAGRIQLRSCQCTRLLQLLSIFTFPYDGIVRNSFDVLPQTFYIIQHLFII